MLDHYAQGCEGVGGKLRDPLQTLESTRGSGLAIRGATGATRVVVLDDLRCALGKVDWREVVVASVEDFISQQFFGKSVVALGLENRQEIQACALVVRGCTAGDLRRSMSGRRVTFGERFGYDDMGQSADITVATRNTRHFEPLGFVCLDPWAFDV